MNSSLIECARSWIDVKFLYRGHRRSGCDCVGLMVGVLMECGLKTDFLQFYLSHSAGNAKYIDGHKIAWVFKTFFIQVESHFVREGDFVVFAINRKFPNHLGLVSKAEPVYFVHAHRGVGRVVENVCDGFWKASVWGFFRYNF